MSTQCCTKHSSCDLKDYITSLRSVGVISSGFSITSLVFALETQAGGKKGKVSKRETFLSHTWVLGFTLL